MSNPLPRIQDKLIRRTDNFLRTTKTLSSVRIDHAVNAESITGDSIAKLQVIVPGQEKVSLDTTERDQAFLQICKYYRDGFYARPNIFTCEVPEAFCHVGTGLVCTKEFDALNDSQMEYRMDVGPAEVGNQLYRPFKWFKPMRAPRLAGTYATIGNIYQGYWGHWVFDCLPRLYSLEKASEGKRVTLLVADNMPASWYDSLDCVLPANFGIQRMPANSWVQVDRMLLASYATGRANFHLPVEFSDFVRHACFLKSGLPLENASSERIYVSRAATRHRRVLNEEALVKLLSRYGFKTVDLAQLNFRQQVELFHRAEIVVGVDGSNWGDMMFAGNIKICVLYASPVPNTHWFTASKALGQEHFFLTSDGDTHSDFRVNLDEMERLLIHEMGLQSAD